MAHATPTSTSNFASDGSSVTGAANNPIGRSGSMVDTFNNENSPENSIAASPFAKAVNPAVESESI